MLRRAPLIPLIIVLGFIITAIFANWIAPHDPYEVSLGDRFKPPFWYSNGSTANLLGTDELGRDMLTRIIYGARVSLIVAAAAIGLGAAIGVTLGLISGYFGGWVDAVIQRVADAFIAFPLILIALLFAVVFGPSLFNLIIIIAILFWSRYARMIRGETLSYKSRDFVALAKVAGCSSFRIILRHIFPNIVNTMVVMMTLEVGAVILIEASLSFLGAGVPPPTPAWGYMISSGRTSIQIAWWVSTMPGIAILLVVLSANLMGDWLRDTLDPKLRQL